MSNPRFEVLMWAQRLLALEQAPAHELLDLPADATVDMAQEAFHKIARTAHPDLHRRGMSPEELANVELAYARAAGAYQELRKQRSQTTRMRPLKDDPLAGIPGVVRPFGPNPTAATAPPAAAAPARAATPSASPPAPGATTPPAAARAGSTTPPAGTAAQAPAGMNSKARLYYRKAQSALRQGDFRTALLQMKMAIAADPQSTVLRQALTEIEAELAK